MLRVHHLRIGRAVWTLWLIEELGLDYDLVTYDRNPKTRRAPPELRDVHPLGKSPLIEDDGMQVSESGAIAAYLVEHYDDAGLLAPATDDRSARAEWTQWLHYAEGSAVLPMMMKLLLASETADAKRIAPLPPRRLRCSLITSLTSWGTKSSFWGIGCRLPILAWALW